MSRCRPPSPSQARAGATLSPTNKRIPAIARFIRYPSDRIRRLLNGNTGGAKEFRREILFPGQPISKSAHRGVLSIVKRELLSLAQAGRKSYREDREESP